MAKTILISLTEPEVSRIAVVQDRVLQEFYFEHNGQAKHVNNIYKGRVVNVEPSIDAAFLDLGQDRNGFLHESDVMDDHKQLFVGEDAMEPPPSPNGRNGSQKEEASSHGRRRPKHRSINGLISKGQDVVVQVTKDSIGNKGPTLSTNISIPGRYLVLMPSLHRWGISRKIDDENERKRLKSVMSELDPPEGMGFIVRTAGTDKTKSDLAKDLRYLLKLWKVIHKRVNNTRGPSLIYQESDLVTRIMRDTFTPDVDEILVDSDSVAKKCTDFLKIFSPRSQSKVKVFRGRKPIFYQYEVEEQIEGMFERKIPLKSGGSIVIDQTEALVAIDVNSGKYKQEGQLEDTAFSINMEAVLEIARQIRLRDLGGVIINDFIDMRDEAHRKEVFRAFKLALKDDRARTKPLPISQLGIIEMTRQRVWPNMDRTFLRPCSHCGGQGVVKTEDYLVGFLLRQVRYVLGTPRSHGAEIVAAVGVAERLHNEKRRVLADLESESGKVIRVVINPRLRETDSHVASILSEGRRAPVQRKR